jgi:hypothetical protein
MNNKEKLYLVKQAFPKDELRAFFAPESKGGHAPGSIGAAFQPNNVDYYGGGGPAIGSRDFRKLPQAQRQGMINARDQEQDVGELVNSFDQPHPRLLKDRYGKKLFPNYSQIPTAKGGLYNIPARPAAHPLSKQNQGLPDPAGVKNTTERMDRGMPVQPHSPYERERPYPTPGNVRTRNG